MGRLPQNNSASALTTHQLQVEKMQVKMHTKCTQNAGDYEIIKWWTEAHLKQLFNINIKVHSFIHTNTKHHHVNTHETEIMQYTFI